MIFIRVGEALLYFVLAAVFAMVTFYKFTNDTGADGMILWHQVETQPFNIVLTFVFLLLGIFKILEVLNNESK